MNWHKLIRTRRRLSEQGFTMMELMIVVAMMVTLTAIALPTIVAWRNNQYFRQAALGIELALRQGRSAALSSNLQQMVVFKPNSSSSQTFTGSLPYNTPVTGWSSSNQPTIFPAASLVIRSGATGTSHANVYVKFSPNGTAQLMAPDNTTPSDPNISVNDQSTQKYLITVTPTGRISLTHK